MATDTFTVKVELATRAARNAMRGLREARKMTRDRAATIIQGRASRQLQQIAGAVGGYAAVNRATRKMRGASEQVDPWEQAMVPIIAKTQQTVDDAVGFSAAARRAARQDTAQMLAANVGAGASVSDARQVFQIRDRIRQSEARGLNIVRQKIKGPTLDELIKSATVGFAKLSGDAWAHIWDRLLGE